MSARIALVGALGYGASYRKQIFEHQEIAGLGELVAAIDPRHAEIPGDDPLRATGVPCYASLDDFLNEGGADLFVIATPIHTHLPLCKAAMATGGHVLLEKPLCATPEEASALIELGSGDQVLSIGYQWSHSEPMQRLKREIAAGHFGAPIDMQVHCLWPRAADYYARAAWAGRQRLDNGTPVFDSPMNNACAHYLFNMLWLWGDTLGSAATPTSIRAALGRAKPIENCDTCLLDIETAAGVPLRFIATHAVQRREGPIISYRFAEATISTGTEYGSAITVDWKDGRSENYGSPDSAHKIASCLQIMAGRRENPCTASAAAMHTTVISTAQSSPIHPAPADRCVDPGDGYCTVSGLEEAIEGPMGEQRMPEIDWLPLSQPLDCEAYLPS